MEDNTQELTDEEIKAKLDSIPDVTLKADLIVAAANALSIANDQRAYGPPDAPTSQMAAMVFNALVSSLPEDYIKENFSPIEEDEESKIIVPDNQIIVP